MHWLRPKYNVVFNVYHAPFYIYLYLDLCPELHVCCLLVVAQLKQGWRETKLSMRVARGGGRGDAKFSLNILWPGLYLTPPTPPYLFALQTLASLQSAGLRMHTTRKV